MMLHLNKDRLYETRIEKSVTAFYRLQVLGIDGELRDMHDS